MSALAGAVAERFGSDWRSLPHVPGAVGGVVGWRQLRQALPELAGRAGLVADPGVLTREAVGLLAPEGVQVEAIADAVEARALAMAHHGTAPVLAALDATLAAVASGHEILAAADPTASDPVVAAERWTDAGRMLAALLADRLAEVCCTLSDWFGAQILGEANPGVPRPQMQAHLADWALTAAGRYVRWQQTGGCRCRDGQCTAESAPKHHLVAWDPSDPQVAHSLSTWMRTWAAGQQKKGRLLPKAFESGIVYRHLLRTVDNPSAVVHVGEVLPEVCIEIGCAGAGAQAHRLTAADPRHLGPRAQRICTTREPAHQLDFALDGRSREILLAGQTHELHGGLAFDREGQRWSLVATRGQRRWLPLPHGRPYEQLVGRTHPRPEGWEPAPLAHKTTRATWEGNDETEADQPSDDDALPGEVRAVIDAVMHETTADDPLIARLGTALIPTGAVARVADCETSACNCEGDDADGDRPAYCVALVEDLALRWMS